MKILIVEDDTRIAAPLAKDLRHQHHSVDMATDRIRALQRRSRELKPQVLRQGELQLDLASRVVTYDQKAIALTPKEYLLLEYFMRHPN